MDSFEINKIIASVLLTALIVIGIGKLADVLFYNEKPKVSAYKVEGVGESLVKEQLTDSFITSPCKPVNFNSIKEKNGLANNVVFSVSVDKDDKIWVATNGGINMLSPNLKIIEATYKKQTPFYCSYYYLTILIIKYTSK